MMAQWRAVRDDRDRESGLTLVETLVYSVLLSIVLLLVGSLLINTLRVREDSNAVNQTSNTAQTAVVGMERGMRNAVASARTQTSDRVTVRIKTRTGDAASPDWLCQGWSLGADHALRSISYRETGGKPTGADDPTTWDVVANDVSARGSADVRDAFVLTVNRLSIALSFDPGRSKPPVELTSEVVSRQQSSTTIPGGSTCF